MSIDLSGKTIHASVDDHVLAWAYCEASNHPNGRKAGLAQQRAFMLSFEPQVYIRGTAGLPTLSVGIHPDGFSDMLEVIKDCQTADSRAYVGKVGWKWELRDLVDSRKIR